MQEKTRRRDGRYAPTMAPGKKFVQIPMPMVVDRRKESEAPDPPLVKIPEEFLPPHFNSKTVLVMDGAPGSHSKDWDL